MIKRLSHGVFILMLALSLCEKDSLAGPHPIPKHPAQFIETAAYQWQELNRLHALPFIEPAIGVPTYVPLAELTRGQSEISVDNIYAKIEEHLKMNNLSWHRHAWKLHHDSGLSVVPRTDAIAVVKGPQGYVVIDGHHDLFLSLFVGAKTIAVTVQADYSSMSALDFWKTLKAKNMIYLPETPAQLARHAPDMMTVSNNPNRYLAALLALKVQADFKNGKWKIAKAKGTKDAVWIKLNNGIPFIEFYLAEVIASAGVQYDPNWGVQVPHEIVERVRYSLLHLDQSPHEALLKSTVILSAKESFDRIDQDDSKLEEVLNKRVPRQSASLCGSIFSGN